MHSCLHLMHQMGLATSSGSCIFTEEGSLDERWIVWIKPLLQDLLHKAVPLRLLLLCGMDRRCRRESNLQSCREVHALLTVVSREGLTSRSIESRDQLATATVLLDQLRVFDRPIKTSSKHALFLTCAVIYHPRIRLCCGYP